MHANRPEWTSGYMPLIIGGIGAMGSALLMPWLTVSSPVIGQMAQTGLHLRDGRFLAVGLIVLALFARSEARTPRTATRTALLAGFVLLAVALVFEYRQLTGLAAAFNAQFAQARLGFGFFAMALGLTTSIGGVLKRRIAFQPVPERVDQFVA